MVPPIFSIFSCSSIISITGCLALLSNSVLLASSQPCNRAYSITIHCIPRHIPKSGISSSIEYLTASSLPLMPRSPNPPGISRALNLRILSIFIVSSARIHSISTLAPNSAAACFKASLILI